MANNTNLRVPTADESGQIVQLRFQEFLQNYQQFHLNKNLNNNVTTDESHRLMEEDYMTQIQYMIQCNRSTVYVNFYHIQQMDPEISEAIELDYYRFDPFLRHAVHSIVLQQNEQYVYDLDRGQREFFVAIYNYPVIEGIRGMRTGKIGRLMALSGTVTRTSEVRPELFFAYFICKSCGTVHSHVEQQFQYTEPVVCKNPQCRKSNDFQLVRDKSTFIDWQRLRVQENADEIPAGSMPRCIDAICRNDIVEAAKAGDKVVLTGFVAVIPDTAGLARAGETTAMTSKSSAYQNMNDGVQGLKKLGVKEMTYRLIYIVCSVQILDQRLPITTNTHNTAAVQSNNFHNNTNTGNSSSGGAISNSSSARLLVNSSFKNPHYSRGVFSSVCPYLADLQNSFTLSHSLSSDLATSTLTSAEQYQLSAQQLLLSDEELLTIEKMYRSHQLYNKMAESLCPSVFGHMEVKRGILLMLLGGVHKRTGEGISLRGDINVCVVGDPSCAKSQFLKYVHHFLPRTVYTSGKSSTAAGLTASVVRDAETGEFAIEAGALMLADNGICCIDEFDKMDSNDQVAIHEAMEQQTISITKAGIQATLNARTSILAAANPIHGRYDRTKTLKHNINISAAIMSRFDLFFVILDECNQKVDELIARHIINNHKFHLPSNDSTDTNDTANPPDTHNTNSKVPFSREELQKYITFARTFNPVFAKSSEAVLIDCYRLLRQNDILGKNKTSYRITVRQLESLIRLSEALARLHLDNEVKDVYVREAYRLLQRSIIFIESEDVELEDIEEEMEQMRTAEDGHATDHVNDHDNDQQGMDTTVDYNDISNSTEHPASNDNADKTETSNKGHSSTEETQPKKKSSTAANNKSSISAKEYEEVLQLLVLRLKTLEEDHVSTSSESEFPGIKWEDLTEWYLVTQYDKSMRDNDPDIDTASDEYSANREHRKKLINQVVRRIVKYDGSIVAMEPKTTSDAVEDTTKSKADKYDKLLRVHPSQMS